MAKTLGHTQLKTSQRYAHLSNETMLAAVDAAAGATEMDWGRLDVGTVAAHGMAA